MCNVNFKASAVFTRGTNQIVPCLKLHVADQEHRGFGDASPTMPRTWPQKKNLLVDLFPSSWLLFSFPTLCSPIRITGLCPSSRDVATSCQGIINSFIEKATQRTRSPSVLNQQTDIKRTLFVLNSYLHYLLSLTVLQPENLKKTELFLGM